MWWRIWSCECPGAVELWRSKVADVFEHLKTRKITKTVFVCSLLNFFPSLSVSLYVCTICLQVLYVFCCHNDAEWPKWREVRFGHLNFQKSSASIASWFSLANVLRATTVCIWGAMLPPERSTPTALQRSKNYYWRFCAIPLSVYISSSLTSSLRDYLLQL